VVVFVVTACSSLLLHLSMRSKSKMPPAKEAANLNASSACLSLLRTAAAPFSDGLLVIVVMVIGVLVWTSGGAAGEIAAAPVAWGLLALHLSCAWLSGHVEKTCWRACSAGFFWHLLVITCMVLPCGSDGDVLGLPCVSLVLVPCSAMLLDYKSTMLLSLLSTGTAACCHVARFGAWARPKGGPGGPSEPGFDRLVLALILDAMSFVAAFAAASALAFWQQRTASRESAMLRVLTALSDAQVMLDSEFLILDSSAKFANMVRLDASDAKALQVLSFLSFLRDEEERLKFKKFLEKSSEQSQASPAAAIHLSMRDAADEHVEVEVFHSPVGKSIHFLVLREVSSHLRVDTTCNMTSGLDTLPAVPDIQNTKSGLSRAVTASDVSCSSVRDMPEFEKLVLDVDVSTRRLAVKSATLNFSDEGDILSFVDYLEPRVRRPFTEWLRMQAAQAETQAPNSNVFGSPLDFRVSGAVSSRMRSMKVRCVGRTGPGPEGQDEGGSQATVGDELSEDSDSELSALQRLVDEGFEDVEGIEELLAAQEDALARRCLQVQARIQSLKAPRPTWRRIELEQFVQQR